MDGAAQSAGTQIAVTSPVTRLNADALARTLDAALERIGTPSRVVAAFDADETLWTMDVGDTLFEHALAAGLIGAAAGDALREIALRNGVARGGSPGELAARLFRAYRDGHMPERDCAEMQTRCYAGWSRSDLDAYAADTLSEARVAPRLFAPSVAMLRWARARGVRSIVVSASPAAAVEAAARCCGIGAPDVFAARTMPKVDVLTDTLDAPLPWGAQKAVLARAAVGDGQWLASFGDSAFDIELLKGASVAVAVRPKPALRAQFGQVRVPLYELVAPPGGDA